MALSKNANEDSPVSEAVGDFECYELDYDSEKSQGDKCGICGSDFETPKSLKCLHSFCQKCLCAKANAGENKVTCPTCDEITPLPRKGVVGLNTNYMLIDLQKRQSLTEQLNTKEKMIPCTYCNHDSSSKAKSWCKECEEYLCEIALKIHKSQRKAKLHNVISLEELRSGEVLSLGIQMERMCPKHSDEKLRFYCETCEVPFCRDCGIIDHPRSENHAQVYLEDAVKNRLNNIQQVAEKCVRVALEVDAAIVQDEKIQTALQKAVDQMLNYYNKAARFVEAKFSDNQKQHKDKFMTDLTQFDEKRKQDVGFHKQKLKNTRSRISSALAMANMLALSGTQYDIADMYKDVITALRELCDFKPVAERFSNIDFKPNDDCLPAVENLPAPGSLKLGIWELKHEFGKDGGGKLGAARGITFTSTGDIVVTDYLAMNIKVFNGQGKLKTIPNPGNFSYPFDVTITSDGYCYVTDTSQLVKIFNAQIEYQTNIQSTSSTLYGVAATKNGGWAVSQNVIHVYNNAGSIAANIQVMQPQFITVTSKNYFVISSVNQKSVQMVNEGGQLIQVIGPPESVDRSKWIPYGVCCSPDDEILIANRGVGAMGIFMFKPSGEFIDCITTEVNNPWGLAMSDDGNKIAVVDEDGLSVKIIGLK